MSLTVILRDFYGFWLFSADKPKKLPPLIILFTLSNTHKYNIPYIPWKRQILFVRLNDFCNKCATKLLSSITSVKWPHLWRRISKHNVDFLTKNFIWTNHIFILLEVTWSSMFRNHPQFLYQKSVWIIWFSILVLLDHSYFWST